jgi:dihydrofolate synthase/folylpolyglutamate synthase
MLESVVAQARAQLGGEWIETSVFPCRVLGGAEGAMNLVNAVNTMNARRAEANAADAPDSVGGPRWLLETAWGEAPLSLLGARAAENTSLALTTLNALGFDMPALLPALSELQWPCRMEKFVVRGRSVYLSGDHNPQGIESLKEILSHISYARLFIIVGVGKNKDIGAMLESLKRMERVSITLTVTPFRSSTAGELEAYRDRVDEVNENPSRSLGEALARSTARDVIVITGSLYLAGYFRAEFLRAEDD